MRKFYKQAEAGTAPGGFVIRLDGKTLKTPLQNTLILQSEAIAKAMAAEWNAQKQDVIPASMPLTQLVNTMIDKSNGADRAAMEDEVLKYAGSDLVCYFATHPFDLVERQEKLWLPLIADLKKAHGVTLKTVQGIQYISQDDAVLKTMKRHTTGMAAAEFTALQALTPVLGSFVIALAIVEGRTDIETAWQAACVDEIYQLEKWGEDEIARKRLDKIKAELETTQEFLAGFKPSS